MHGTKKSHGENDPWLFSWCSVDGLTPQASILLRLVQFPVQLQPRRLPQCRRRLAMRTGGALLGGDCHRIARPGKLLRGFNAEAELLPCSQGFVCHAASSPAFCSGSSLPLSARHYSTYRDKSSLTASSARRALT